MKTFLEYLMESKKIIAYHYTHSEHFDKFEQLTHFGTLNAAVTRGVNSTKKVVGTPRLYEVELDIKNPYRLTYEEEEDDAKLWRNTFVNHKHPELEKVWNDKDKIYTSIQAFKKLGYDGIVYSNTYDDNGADSYIIFYPEQAKIIKTVAEGKSAMRKLQRKMGWE